LEVGKDGNIYGFDAMNLGNGIGVAPLFKTQVVTRNIVVASAAVPNDEGTMVVLDAQTSGKGINCPDGQAGDLVGGQIVAGAPDNPPSARVAWCAPSGGHGSPIITTTDGRFEAIAWVTGASQPGRLLGYDAQNGDPVFTGGDDDMTMLGLHRFATLIAAN